MKKDSKKKPERRPEYDFAQGVRGKHAKRYAEGTNLVVLDPDLRDVFTDSKSVNQALRAIAKIVRSQAKAKSTAGK